MFLSSAKQNTFKLPPLCRTTARHPLILASPLGALPLSPTNFPQVPAFSPAKVVETLSNPDALTYFPPPQAEQTIDRRTHSARVAIFDFTSIKTLWSRSPRRHILNFLSLFTKALSHVSCCPISLIRYTRSSSRVSQFFFLLDRTKWPCVTSGFTTCVSIPCPFLAGTVTNSLPQTTVPDF